MPLKVLLTWHDLQSVVVCFPVNLKAVRLWSNLPPVASAPVSEATCQLVVVALHSPCRTSRGALRLSVHDTQEVECPKLVIRVAGLAVRGGVRRSA